MKALCIYNDFHHPGGLVRSGLEQIAPPEVFIDFTDAENGIPEGFPTDYGILILSKAGMTSSDKEASWVTGEWERTIRNFVENGGVLLAIHSGIAGYENSSILSSLLCGTFKWHPEMCEVSYLTDTEEFTCWDEHYFVNLADEDAEVFLTSESRHGIQPAGWICTRGRGRVVVLTPGHTSDVWNHPAFRKIVLQALQTRE